MEQKRRQGRWAQLIVTVAIVSGLAVSQPFLASADEEKTGEAAIEAALGGLNGEPATEEEAAPPAEGTTEEAPPPEEAPPAESEAPAEGEAAPAEGEAAPAASGEAAPATEETASSGGASNETSGGSAEGAPTDDQASGGESQRGNNATTPESQGLAEGAISEILFGGGAAANQPAIAGGVDEQSAEQSAQGSAQQATDVRTVGDDLRAAAPTNNNRGDGSNREENGTVVVNNLEDSGDQGKLAVHGHIVAGTLCDGSQFWSLDGGGTVNANGVTLSANGGTAGTDAGGGDDNAAGSGGSAGNGGSAHSSADGGIVVVDELVTGNNTGNQVSVGDQSFNGDCGQGVIDGGDATTISNVNISADGGTAFADASGGDDNLAGDGGSAGNGGSARASADGGMVILGSVILGNNEGNTVDVNSAGGSGSGGSCLVDGGTSTTISNIDVSADGGIALADASGGDDNVAFGEDAEAGNGGRAVANADGGLILGGDIITGNNQGNQIEGTCGGAGNGTGGGITQVYGGDVVNQTDITLSADGGLAVADASGGDGNIALGSGNDDAAAGNGGVARSNATGGVIQVGDIVTGNNVGNVIAFGANLAPVPGGSDEPKPSRVRIDKQPATSKPARTISKKAAQGAPAGRATKAVGKLPDTGVGTGLVAGQPFGTSQVLGGLALLGVAAVGLYSAGGNRFALVSNRANRPIVRRGG